MKKSYIMPEFAVNAVSSEDIMEGSDTFIDVGHLWSTSTTGETE